MRDWSAVSVPAKRLIYAATVFWSALLLLLVQPILTKFLPWFGGSAGVWTTSMLFYQTLLLLGYGYAHLTTRMLPPRAQMLLHIVLLLARWPCLPIHPSAAWKPTTGGRSESAHPWTSADTVGLPVLPVGSDESFGAIVVHAHSARYVPTGCSRYRMSDRLFLCWHIR